MRFTAVYFIDFERQIQKKRITKLRLIAAFNVLKFTLVYILSKNSICRGKIALKHVLLYCIVPPRG